MKLWTEGLSRQQLAVIEQDTKEFESKHPDQPQQHVYKDIALELRKREERRTSNDK